MSDEEESCQLHLLLLMSSDGASRNDHVLFHRQFTTPREKSIHDVHFIFVIISQLIIIMLLLTVLSLELPRLQQQV